MVGDKSSSDDSFEEGGEELGLGDLDNYKGKAKTPKKAQEKVEKMLGYVQVVGTILSVIILMIIGFKYMLGSMEEKAEYKKTLIPYIIGAFMLFSGSFVPQIIYQIAQNI